MRKPFKNIGEILSSNGVSQTADFVKLNKFWAKIVGDHLAKNTRPLKLYRGSLTLATTNPQFSSHLKYFEEKIIEKIESFYPSFKGHITGIRFQLMPPEKFESILVKNNTVKKESAKIFKEKKILNPNDFRELQEAAKEFEFIKDDEVQKTLASLKLQIFKK